MPLQVEVSACLDKLAGSQNTDGGWGYHPGSTSAVEPTCWAIRALSGRDAEALERGRKYLITAQDRQGFWPAFSVMQSGSWVTSLACAVLCSQPDAGAAVSAGLAWVCNDFPLDSSFVVRTLRRLRRNRHITEVDESLRGWGWTPRTSSWVEPTAFALLALEECDGALLPKQAQERVEMGVKLLYDRMCPGGGWNCGNPRVYGVDGEPLMLPTSWALLALRNREERPGRALSLEWLSRAALQAQSPGSLAAAKICLDCYGIATDSVNERLQRYMAETPFRDGIHVLAWSALALHPQRNWPSRGKRDA